MRKALLILLSLAVCGTLTAFAGDNINDESMPEIIRSADGLIAHRNIELSQPSEGNNDVALDIPVNDDCMNAIEIDGFFENLAWDNREATFDGPGECLVEPNLWYLYTATITGKIIINTVDPVWDPTTHLDTRLAVYDGSVCPVAGAEPEIQEVPGGETIETAVAITGMLPIAYSGNTETYNHDYDFPNVVPNMYAPDVVYSYTATFDGRVTFSLCGSQENFNTVLAIYDEDGNELAFSNDGHCIDIHSRILNFPVTNGETYYVIVSGAQELFPILVNKGDYILTISSPDYYLIECNQDFGSRYSQITLDVEEHHQYLIEVGGEMGHPTGCGVLNIYQVPEPPANDDCEDAFDLGVIQPYQPIIAEGQTNIGATFDCPAINEVPEIWVKFTLEQTMDVNLNFCGSADWPNSEFQTVYTYLTRSCPCDDDPIISNFVDFIECGGYADFWVVFNELEPGTYLYPIASYYGNPDGYYITIVGIGDEVCDSDALYGQNPSTNGEVLSFYCSDENVGLASAEKFTGVGDEFNKITWWGAMLDDELLSCISDPHPFQLIFCHNNFSQPSIPGDTVAFYDVSVSPLVTGVQFEGYHEVKYTAEFMPPVDLGSGWVIIRGAGDNDCYFFWQDAHNGASAQYKDNTEQWTSLSQDLAFCLSFDSTVTGIDEPGNTPIPEQVSLLQNYPNPFNAETSIQFALHNAGEVTVSIYDVSGRLVKTVYNGNLPAGNHSLIWNGTADSGEQVSSGIYFYRLQTAGNTISKSMVLLK